MGMIERLEELWDVIGEKAPLLFEHRRADIIADIDENGTLLSARRSSEYVPVPINVTASSLSRKSDPLPLCDRLCFLADDLPDDGALHAVYAARLREWAQSRFSTAPLRAVLRCISAGGLCERLSRFGVLSGKPAQNRRLFIVFAVNGVHLYEHERFVRSVADRFRESPDGLRRCFDPEMLFPAALTSPRSRARLISAPPRGTLHSEISVRIGAESLLKAHEALRQLLWQTGVRVGESFFAAFTEQGMLPLYGIFDGEVCSQHQARGRTVCVMCVSEYSESRLSVTLYRELPREAFNEAVSRMAESGAAPIRAQALMRAGRASSPRYAETLCRRLLSQLLDNSQNGDAVLPSQSGRVYN